MNDFQFLSLTRRHLITGALATATMGLSISACSEGLSEFQEGQHYHILSENIATEGDGIEIRELFWYGCPHCYTLEPHIENWLKNKPEGVNFVREPALFNPNWNFDAKAFYTFEELGILDEVNAAYFDYIHKENMHVTNADELITFLKPYNVDEDKVRDTLKSFAIDTKIRKRMLVQPKYMVMGVPAVIINGKYRSSVSDAGGNDRLISLINYLIEIERG